MLKIYCIPKRLMQFLALQLRHSCTHIYSVFKLKFDLEKTKIELEFCIKKIEDKVGTC
jgi:hypothetical protein